MVKENAPELLSRELASRKWKPQELAMGGVTDCYWPVECRLRLTRKCLEVLAEFRNPVSIGTKNYLVTRDLDLLRELAAHHAVIVHLSINSLNRIKNDWWRIQEEQGIELMLRMTRADVQIVEFPYADDW